MHSARETEIFAKALLESGAEEREAYLDDACGGDGELRKRMERLLEAHFGPEPMLDPPRDDATSPETEPFLGMDSGTTQIGPYKVLQKIGEGGMGVVYMAEQTTPVKRRVALKVVKPGMDSRQVLARFDAERQALAMMDHPNIAKVLDAGTTESGRPYFVMELVHGLPITEYADEQKLGPEQRLELFVSTCRGIQHAHQKGIIHRDIKPSNILVAEYDETPVPKIIDFGVAKALNQQLTDSTLYTEFGQVIGTLEYMSPEQAKRNQLDIDTRSDVYSLGIVLYSLLTGETPFGPDRFRNAAWDELLRVIREEEPKRPSIQLTSSQQLAKVASNRRTEPARLAALLRGDLDWIVLKALEKDRNKRYATASEFAEDVSRHLAQHPVVARPPSVMDRVTKFLKRNRMSVATGALACIAVVIIGYVLVSAAQAERKRFVEDRAQRSNALSDAMNDASLALGMAVNAPMGQRAEWIAVDTSVKQLNSLLDSGPADREIESQTKDLLARIKLSKQDRQLGELMEEVLLAGATQMTLESWQAMEARFRELFRSIGMDLDNDAPIDVAKRIREHPSAMRLTEALELWIGTRGQMQSLGGPRLTAEIMQPWAEAMYIADEDPLRTGVRKQIYTRTMDSDLLDKLVSESDLSEQGPRALSWLAVTYLGCKAPEKAEAVFEQALQQFPQDVMLNYDYALALDQQNRKQEAIRIYNRCLALRPDVAGFWVSMAEILEEEGELDSAENARARASELEGP